MIENVMNDLAKEIGGGKMNNIYYEGIDELINKLQKIDCSDYDTKEALIEDFKDILEDSLYWTKQDLAIINEKCDVDKEIEENKIRQYEGE